ncbi:MAG TPA: MlaD family protein [Burkholderiaceae bacterium]|nr:MlaD family protein [Burkholderiaceae bacterium]HQR71267.1 MlaD family protein [Burkholderiaceae bacterium]
MEAEAKYTYVGLAVIALIAALVTGIVWLKHSGSRSDFNFYTIYFERQPLDGLQIGADVSMRGIKVGRVEDYALTENINRVRVLIRIDRRTPVSTNTVAVVNRRFVTGIAKIDLETPDPPGPPLLAVPLNEQFSVIPEGTSNLDAITMRLNRVGETAAETLERLNDVLRPENRAAIDKTIANLRDLTGALNKRMADLDRALAAFSSAADKVGRASDSVATLADAASHDLRPALQQAERTMKDISAATIALEKQAAFVAQSVGSTVNSSGDQLSAAVTELKATGATLNRLLDRMQDPRAALLGPSAGQRGPGE